MGLLNYTTQIESEKSIAEIQSKLARAGAQAILMEYDGFGGVAAVSFRITTPMGQLGFRLPANIEPVLAVLNRQAASGKIPKRMKGDVRQARRVAWRILKDWIEAQLALVETQMVSVDQVFLPYAQNPETGQTLYEQIEAQKFMGLAIPEKCG